MASFIRQGAAVTASILEAAAGALRKLAATERASPPRPEPAATEPVPSGTPPAPGTRTRISNPKAARKVRARRG